MAQKNKVPYAHPIDSYHKNPDSFGNGDYPSPFEWVAPEWLKGRPKPIADPNPLRPRYYYKYLRALDGHLRWLATWEDALSQEDGAKLITRSTGSNNVECISKEEYLQLKARLKRMKIIEYEV